MIKLSFSIFMQYLYVKHREALIDIFTETGTDGYFVTSVVLALQYLFHTHNFTKNMQKF